MASLPLAYLDQGNGMPVVLLHGFPLDRRLWTHQRALGARYRLVLPDLRGFGQTPVAPGDEAGVPMDRYARDVGDLLDDLGLERVVLGGLSMGGYVAMACWRRFPERISAMVLFDTKSAADAPETRANREPMATKALTEGAASLVEGQLPGLLTRRTLAEHPEVVSAVSRMIAESAPRGIAGASRGMAARPDSTPLLATIAVPTLLLVGAEDAISPLAEMRAMAEAIPGARLAVIPGAAHLTPLEAPEAVNQALGGFLGAVQV